MRPLIYVYPKIKAPDLLIRQSLQEVQRLEDGSGEYVRSIIVGEELVDGHPTIVIRSDYFQDRDCNCLLYSDYSNYAPDLRYKATGWVHYAGMYFPTTTACPDYPRFIPWHKATWFKQAYGMELVHPAYEGQMYEGTGSDSVLPAADLGKPIQQGTSELVALLPPRNPPSRVGCGCGTLWLVRKPRNDVTPDLPASEGPIEGDRGEPYRFSESARRYWQMSRYWSEDRKETERRKLITRIGIDPLRYNPDGTPIRDDKPGVLPERGNTAVPGADYISEEDETPGFGTVAIVDAQGDAGLSEGQTNETPETFEEYKRRIQEKYPQQIPDKYLHEWYQHEKSRKGSQPTGSVPNYSTGQPQVGWQDHMHTVSDSSYVGNTTANDTGTQQTATGQNNQHFTFPSKK